MTVDPEGWPSSWRDHEAPARVADLTADVTGQTDLRDLLAFLAEPRTVTPLERYL